MFTVQNTSTRLFVNKDTSFNVGTGDISRCVEINAYEFTLFENGGKTHGQCENSECHSKKIHIVLTNREELSFFTVFALPNASNIGLAWSSCCSNSPCNECESVGIFAI